MKALFAVVVVLALAGFAVYKVAPGLLPSGPKRERDTVQRIVDGDTLVLEDAGRVRIIGLDTPETTKGKNECGGQVAEDYLRRTLPPYSPVRYEAGAEAEDRYGRKLVYLLDGDDLVAEQMLRQGMGKRLTIGRNRRYLARLKRAERSAKRADRGIWGNCS